VSSGPRAGVANATFGNRALALGDAVLIELWACRRRYFAALMRTVVVGEPDEEMARVGSVLERALSAAIAAVAPGATCAEVDAACRSVIEEAGYGESFRKPTGYSVGIAFAPGWGEGRIVSLRPGDGTRLEAGMVLHIAPAIRAFRRFGAGLSETVLVTGQGSEILTDFRRALLTR
jgi:Xaa-Pro dipeptidase